MVIVFFRTLYVHRVFAVLLCILRRIAFLLLARQKIWVCRELWFSKNLGLCWISIGVIFVLWQWKARHWVGITEYNQNNFSGIMHCLVPALKDPIIKRAVLHCRKGYRGRQEGRAWLLPLPVSPGLTSPGFLPGEKRLLQGVTQNKPLFSF